MSHGVPLCSSPLPANVSQEGGVSGAGEAAGPCPHTGFQQQKRWRYQQPAARVNFQGKMLSENGQFSKGLLLLRRRVPSDPFLPPWPARAPWDFPGKNSGVCGHFLLQGIFPTRGSNPPLLRLLCRQAGSSPLSHQRNPSKSYFHCCNICELTVTLESEDTFLAAREL